MQYINFQFKYDALVDGNEKNIILIASLTEIVNEFETALSCVKNHETKESQTESDWFDLNMEEYECDECGFDTVIKDQFDWHMSDYHGWPKPTIDTSDYEFCNFCDINFNSKNNFMNHK